MCTYSQVDANIWKITYTDTHELHVRGMVNKLVLGGQMCSWLLRLDRQYVVRIILQKVIHAEAFDKVGNALKKLCNAW